MNAITTNRYEQVIAKMFYSCLNTKLIDSNDFVHTATFQAMYNQNHQTVDCTGKSYKARSGNTSFT